MKNKKALEPVASQKDLKARLEDLPALSLKAYRVLQDELLYAEAGFTDVVRPSWADAVGITEDQLKGVITKLTDAGLIWSWNPSNEGRFILGANPNEDFYGTYEHRDSEDWTEAPRGDNQQVEVSK